jgi:hypothetical protein
MIERILFFENMYNNKNSDDNTNINHNTDMRISNDNEPEKDSDENKLNNIEQTSLFSGLEIKEDDLSIFDQLEQKMRDIRLTENNTIGVIGGKRPKNNKQIQLDEEIEDKINELEMLIDAPIQEPSFKPNNLDINETIDVEPPRLGYGKSRIFKRAIPSSTTRTNRSPIREQLRKKYKYCSHCKIIFKSDDSYREHMAKHNNQSENSACVCKNCGKAFYNDDEFYTHREYCKNKKKEIDEINVNEIPESIFGTYICPVCQKKYDNSFFLGEHFIQSHNDYDVLCKLDVKNHNGFPGYSLLYKIGMVKQFRKKKQNISNEKCDICFFNYEYNKENILKCKRENEIIQDNRNPIKLRCCRRMLCHDCLMHHIIETDSIICPFCRRDHTRTDLQYIVYVDQVDQTDRDKWIPWWENHMEIFLS